ncbi:MULTISPECIES: LysR family transcriptional regulator [unclassified Herbaspirillum]|uniref:LysR family transcriptional regulator n=1 Tax=unclassified Herbaspirillum TaxID=2624150 RepID=UPI000E2F088F|nr:MULTISPECIES: LysR family transcriptional regulator [unclassified Herbaspirillum]RFB69612.1 LysR family transcriptional regulator [Herbaspirillum sp. 3R-3a1]TFI07329.1 LysR family transcriptional regulator [Herbaspirillum sp. 3R11]TFI12104.1 LysR family transcriptional regulator [Herbaspirillum sp. 3R-11]TFI29820.1 LysR family transcriptional regulator [Herbaspirillum sp. 3C11]
MIQLDFDERDLRSLRVFCNAAQAGGFAAAEKRLHMSKASISRHVREVEERLGVRLCERGPAGFKLTPEGEVALKLASDALRSLERIRSEIDAVHGVLSGSLSIGIVEHTLTHPDCKIPEALAILRERAPNVRPEISVMTFPDLNQALREHRVDIAIRGRYPREGEFSYLPLFAETHRVYTAAKKTRRGADDLPLVYRPHPYVDQALATEGYARGPDAGGLEAIGLLVATGCYLGILPVHYVQLLGKRYALRTRSNSPSYHHQICAVTESSRPTTYRADLFLGILRELHPGNSGN